MVYIRLFKSVIAHLGHVRSSGGKSINGSMVVGKQDVLPFSGDSKSFSIQISSLSTSFVIKSIYYGKEDAKLRFFIYFLYILMFFFYSYPNFNFISPLKCIRRAPQSDIRAFRELLSEKPSSTSTHGSTKTLWNCRLCAPFVLTCC